MMSGGMPPQMKLSSNTWKLLYRTVSPDGLCGSLAS